MDNPIKGDWRWRLSQWLRVDAPLLVCRIFKHRWEPMETGYRCPLCKSAKVRVDRVKMEDRPIEPGRVPYADLKLRSYDMGLRAREKSGDDWH